MSSGNCVEIRCDGGPGIGYGHIARSRTLASQLASAGVSVRLVGLSKFSNKVITAPEGDNRKADVVIFDTPVDVSEQIENCRLDGIPSVALDWFGCALPDVNICVYPHREVRSAIRSHVGLDYVLIRPDIVALRNDGSIKSGDNALVVLGGADIKNQGISVARTLVQSGLEVDLVCGPLSQLLSPEAGINVVRDPPDFAIRLARSKWIATNGGGCLFESMCLGKATIIFPQTDYELSLANMVHRFGGAIGIGFDALQHAYTDSIKRVGSKAALIIDGNGALRVATIVMELL